MSVENAVSMISNSNLLQGINILQNTFSKKAKIWRGEFGSHRHQ